MEKEKEVRIVPEEQPPEDTRAQEEIQALEKESLESDRQRKEHLRREELRDVFARCVRRLLIFVFVLIGAALATAAWHYLAPTCWHWMENDALKSVTTFLFSGTLVGFLGLYIRDRV